MKEKKWVKCKNRVYFTLNVSLNIHRSKSCQKNNQWVSSLPQQPVAHLQLLSLRMQEVKKSICCLALFSFLALSVVHPIYASVWKDQMTLYKYQKWVISQTTMVWCRTCKDYWLRFGLRFGAHCSVQVTCRTVTLKASNTDELELFLKSLSSLRFVVEKLSDC